MTSEGERTKKKLPTKKRLGPTKRDGFLEVSKFSFCVCLLKNLWCFQNKLSVFCYWKKKTTNIWETWDYLDHLQYLTISCCIGEYIFYSFSSLSSFYKFTFLHKYEMCLLTPTVYLLLWWRQLWGQGKGDKLDSCFSEKEVTVLCSGMSFAFMRYFLMCLSEQVSSTVFNISEYAWLSHFWCPFDIVFIWFKEKALNHSTL